MATLLRVCGGAAAVLSLAGCAIAPPSGPQVVSLPGSGKTYEQFQSEDGYCRQAAAVQTGPGPSAQQSSDAVVGSAVLGTALGAAAGAAIGSASGAVGGGAAVGGALGLLAGTSIGAGNAQGYAGGLQRNYDIVYSQCMTAKGNSIQAPPPVVVYGAPYDGYGYGYGPYWRRRYYLGY